MDIVTCSLPSTSVLDSSLVAAAYFRDSYRAPLCHAQNGIVDIFFGIFGHHPKWVKVLLVVRNKIASICGLDAATADEILHPRIKSHYAVGDKIGPWPIYAITENELIAGRDNQHLDFRLSVLKITNDVQASVVVSTICTVHNVFGKIYLFFIVPFHKWGVKHIMSNAILAGRL